MDFAPFLSLISYVPYGGTVVGVAALASMALPPPGSGSPVYSALYGFINALGANAYNARNASAPLPASAVLPVAPGSTRSASPDATH